MKVLPHYKPKYSLSIKYLKMIMTRSEFSDLMKNYVAKKKEYWGKYKKGKV